VDQVQAGWDKTTEALVSFAQKSSYESLTPGVVHAVKLRVIDAFASALGAYDNPTSELARKVATRSRTDNPATVWGSNIQTTPEAAAFANGVMTRLLDISDTYLGKSRGHPSDMISGILAVAESVHADGKSVINAITLAYDVYCSFCDAIDVNSVWRAGLRVGRGQAAEALARSNGQCGGDGVGAEYVAGAGAARQSVELEGLRRGECLAQCGVRGAVGARRIHRADRSV
jgi:2-methylcitrate dehydratase PrpD